MMRIKATEMVLQQVQVLDQEVAPPLTVTKQLLNLGKRPGADLSPLRLIRPAPPPRAGMDAPVVSYGAVHVNAAASPSPP